MDDGRRMDVFNGVDEKILVTVDVPANAPDCHQRIEAAFASVDLAHLIVFASPDTNFADLIAKLHTSLECPVIGCTSAGEISHHGFVEGQIVLVGLPKRWFSAHSVLVKTLSAADFRELNDQLIQNRLALSAANPDKRNGFSFLLVDGLSRQEDRLVGAISPGLVGFPLFGGSAGDGLQFVKSFVAFEGNIYEDAATLTFVVTNCEVDVFSINHMEPGQTRMVVTRAMPESRTVCRINDEPAAMEYARLIGKDPKQLDEFIFSENPVTVRVGNEYHVRAIQHVNEAGHLVFFSAIDEGMVLTVAHAQDMAEHLKQELSCLKGEKSRVEILACDCVLRRIEAQKSQSMHKINDIFRAYDVVGFSTYGEQIGPLHVNHTLTGLCLAPPKAGT